MRNISAAIILFLAANSAAAQVSFIRVLVPLFGRQPVPGAYGSLWQSQLAIHNSTFSRTYDIRVCPPGEGCMGVGAAEQELLPGETQLGLPSLYPAPANAAGGAIVYLLSPSADDLGESVVFNLRIVDLSRSATSAGTEIPVVRDRDLYASTIHLLNIPTDARFRLALRVFEMNHDGAKFAVRIFDQTTNSLLATRIITTIVDVPPRRFTPAFAEVADLLSGASAPAQIRIEIEPLTAAVAFWAYVSVTNNDSQQITLVTPQ